jgi:hypothetical protein
VVRSIYSWSLLLTVKSALLLIEKEYSRLYTAVAWGRMEDREIDLSLSLSV